MARIRYLKPQFFKDENIAELTYAERLFFCGLWCFADRNGNLEYRPKWLKVEIFPYDAGLDIVKMLNNLEGQFIKFYEVDDRKYIKINNFHKHQVMHKTEKVLYPDILECSSPVKKSLNQFKPNKKRRNGERNGNGKGNGQGNCKGERTHSPDSKKPESEPLVNIKNKFLPEDIQFVKTMRADISKADSKRKFIGSIETWAEEIRKLREIDNRPLAEIQALWLLIQADPFWQKNILSALKLRSKFSDLKNKLENDESSLSVFEQVRRDLERDNKL